jgi:hypothetical protein
LRVAMNAAFVTIAAVLAAALVVVIVLELMG